MDLKFWRGRNVLLTGHTGFKGGTLSLWLASLGAKVTGVGLPPSTDPSLFDLGRIGSAVHSVLGDVRDGQLLRNIIQDVRPEVVFHLAAQPLVRRSYREPVETYATNVMGTVNLLEAVRHVGSVRACVVVTSDKCYENKERPRGHQEGDALGGADPYSSSKACAELVVAAYRHSYFHPDRWNEHRVGLASARAGNVLGGGDFAEDRLVPDLMRAFAAKRPALIRHPHAIRPWQHVLDSLAGYLLLAERLWGDGPPFAQAWNFGPAAEEAHSVQSLAAALARAWGPGAEIHIDAAASPEHETQELRLDSSRARRLLRWRPCWPLDRTIVEVVRWYQLWATGQPVVNFAREQIAEFQHDLAVGGSVAAQEPGP